MPLTDEQIREAIEQMKTHCDLHMAEYTPLSARSTLYALGYQADADQVLQYIYDRGFTNCLDHRFLSTFYDGSSELRTEYPSEDVCYWGPDQLKSRLNSLF